MAATIETPSRLRPDRTELIGPARRYDIDWLRIAAVLLLIPFHSARVFDIDEDFYVQSEQLSKGLFGFIVFVAQWHMPLLFLLAGSSAWLAMRHRSGSAFARERVKRLLVPFLFGLAVIVPPQSWLGFVSHGRGDPSFFAYYPEFWTTADPDFTGYQGGWTPAHLWFVLWLLVLSLVALPLFLWLRGGGGRRALDLLARPRRLPSILVVAPALLVLTEPLDLMEVTNQNLIGFLLFMVAGFVLVSDERIGQAIDRLWPWALALGSVSMAWFTWRALAWTGGEPPALNDFLVNSLLRQVGAWLMIVGLLGLGRRRLDRPARALPYMAEAAYPFYILHQTVIIALAYGIVQLAVPLPVQYAALAVTALLATVVAYELLVRRWRPARLLFGMKPRPRT
jgi:glucans biosynthesis protein C